jgi:hypothetical protein
MFVNPKNSRNPEICQFTKRRAQKNDEDPSKKISEILKMGSISSRKHEMEIW